MSGCVVYHLHLPLVMSAEVLSHSLHHVLSSLTNFDILNACSLSFVILIACLPAESVHVSSLQVGPQSFVILSTCPELVEGSAAPRLPVERSIVLELQAGRIHAQSNPI